MGLGSIKIKNICKFLNSKSNVVKSSLTTQTFSSVKNETNIQVIKQYSKSGKLEKNIRNITDLSSNSTKTIQTTFNNNIDSGKFFTRDVFINGKLKSSTTEKFSKLNDNSNEFAHTKLEIQPLRSGRYENQTIEMLTKNKEKEYIHTEQYRKANGKTKILKADSNIVASKDIINNKNFKYLPIHLYSQRDFAQSCVHLSKDINSLKKIPNLKFKALKTGYGLNSLSGITINDSKILQNNKMVNTVNHELHHSTQLRIFDAVKKILSEKHSLKNNNYILKEAFSPCLNIVAEPLENFGNLINKLGLTKVGKKVKDTGYKLYYNELIEIQARKAGQDAEQVYKNSCKHISDVFTKMPQSHITSEKEVRKVKISDFGLNW